MGSRGKKQLSFYHPTTIELSSTGRSQLDDRNWAMAVVPITAFSQNSRSVSAKPLTQGFMI
jgi:hypothetical protein